MVSWIWLLSGWLLCVDFGVGEPAKENKIETVAGEGVGTTEVVLAWPQLGDLTSASVRLEELCPLQAPLEARALLHAPPPPATSL